VIDRRTFIRAVVGGLIAWPLIATAQQADHVPRIGYVVAAAHAFGMFPVEQAFLDGLHDLGYVEGRNVVIEIRATEGRPERFAELATELVRLPVDVLLVAVCGTPLDATRRATQAIPIVVATCNDDLIETGIVTSLARPGGNVTGLSKLTPELAAKRLELLKEVAPNLSHVAVLWNPGYSDFKADWREMRAAASRLGMTLDPVEFRNTDDLEAAFATIKSERADGLITFSDTFTYINAKRVAELAAASGLPALFAFREVPDAGGLMSYGPDLRAMWRRAAAYVVKILRGAKAGDLSIEQPTKFELVINLKTAKTLGITIPQSLLLRADEVIR
jgi:putative tryptophan/tyrosine transport system substrate-binding protein